MSSINRSATSRAGFTLIEVLVAFAIAAVMLGALYEVFSTGVRSEGTAERYRNAVLIAQSALDALATVPIRSGDSVDRLSIYERAIRITRRLDLLPQGAPPRVVPYQIEVRVSWRDGIRQRSVNLVTLRLAPPPHS